MAATRRRKACAPVCMTESLEDRALLSATLDGGVLTVEGTADADTLRVHIDRDAPENLLVRDNDVVHTFAIADVTQIVVNAGDGDDRVVLGKRLEIPAEVNGGDGADRLIGGGADDVINGGEGDDRIAGRGGNDNIDAGAGDDRVNGGVGADEIAGGAGNDRLNGYRGPDVITGGDDNDQIDGHFGDDVLEGGDGDDVIRGGAGDDDISGGEGNDKLAAGSGSDMLFGEGGDDTLGGDSREDVLDGGTGENTIRDRANGDGGGGHHDGAKHARRVFRRLDANDDRLLTEDEVSPERWTSLLEFDADGSLDIVFTEFLDWFRDRRGGDGGDPTV